MRARVLKVWAGRFLASNFPRLWLDYQIAWRKHHFEREFWLVPLLCRPDMIAIDVGANMGQYSYYMARFAKETISFEPNQDLWPHLRRLLGPRARLEAAALSDHAGYGNFRYVEGNDGVATVENKNTLSMIGEGQPIKTRLVELRSLDSFTLSNVSFMKIDVEGHEEAVIEGARETLKRCRPALLIESEDRHNPGAPRRLAGQLHDQGYAGFYVKNGKLCDVASIQSRDRDSANLSVPALGYINNYLYLPVERRDLIARIETALEELGPGSRARGFRQARFEPK